MIRYYVIWLVSLALVASSQQQDLLETINGLVNKHLGEVLPPESQAPQRPPSYKELADFKCPTCDILDCNLAFDPTCRLAWKYMPDNETVRFQISLRNPVNQIWLAVGFNKFKQMIGTNVVVMLLGKENFDIYNGYLSNYGPPLKESEVLSNVAVKTQYNRIIISFERSVKFLSTFSGNLYDLSECNNIVVGSGSHAYEGFFFHANVPRFTETCYKVAAAPPPSDTVVTPQPNEVTSSEKTAEPVKSTTNRPPASSSVKTTTQPNSHVPLPPNLRPRPINGLARTYKFHVQLTIMMQFIDDYKSNTTDAYAKLDEKIRKYLMDSLGSGYVKSRLESLKPGSVVASIVLEYKDDIKRSISDIMEDIWFKLLFGDPNLLSINPTALIISDLNQPLIPMTPGGYLTRRVSPLAIILPILTVVFIAALGLVIFVVYRSNKQKRIGIQPSDIVNNETACPTDQCDQKDPVNTVSAGLKSYSQISIGGQQKVNMVNSLQQGQRSPTVNENGEMSSSMGSYLIKTGSATRAKKYNTVKVDANVNTEKEAGKDSFKSKSFSNFPKNDQNDPNHIYENDYDN